MPDNGNSIFEESVLVGILPTLICETRIEKQVANIENWLHQLLPVQTIGFFIHGQKSHDTYAVNADNHAIDNIALLMSESGLGHARAQNSDTALLFEFQDGIVSSYTTRDADIRGAANGIVFGLNHGGHAFGSFFLVAEKDITSIFHKDENQLRWFRSIVSSLMYNTLRHHQYDGKERFFSLYETVSSSLCYAGDLQELLTTIISIIVSEMPSEEGSILLYNDVTDELEFFSAIGDTGCGYVQCRFPANRGIAGKALQEGKPLIVNDVQSCPFFFGDFDEKSGFVTRSILAAPIISGKEKVGVIEAINKVGKDSFDESDKGILMAIADEIGLAVKNARMFDYVVNSYCKIKQGLSSCKGCVRPLRSWTPCARQLDLL